MFGRRKYDDYDEYNEKYASKYDDDYIAPSHDYRKECDHSHEQTYDDMDDIWACHHSHEQSYENINEVKECDHTHEQTYEDADIEQHPYDSYASLESRFQQYLFPNEHLLWAGGYDKISPKPPQEMKKDKKSIAILLIVSMALIFFGCVNSVLGILSFLGFIMMLLTVVAAAGGFNNGIYAITDMRVINIRNGQPIFAPLEMVYNISAVTGSNNKGCVSYSTMHPVRIGQPRQNGEYRSVINGINDPARVKRILQDAVHGAKIKKIN